MRFAAIALLMFFCVRNLEHRAASNALNSHAIVATTPVPATPAPKLSPEEAGTMIRSAALKHKVPAAFVKSIMAAESNFYPGALSNKGAIGLMQLMPETALEYGVDPTIPEQNVDGGAHYLGVLIHRYQKSHDWMRRTIAAYNAGPGMVDRYRGVPPFRETRTYVARVLTYFKRFSKEG
jgi:soluble lytic murein transglycosylase-like protein